MSVLARIFLVILSAIGLAIVLAALLRILRRAVDRSDGRPIGVLRRGSLLVLRLRLLALWRAVRRSRGLRRLLLLIRRLRLLLRRRLLLVRRRNLILALRRTVLLSGRLLGKRPTAQGKGKGSRENRAKQAFAPHRNCWVKIHGFLLDPGPDRDCTLGLRT